jgi:hypothetical protein
MRLLILAAALTAALTACSTSDPTQDRNACLYAAVKAYPAWTASKVPVLDGVPECKDLGPEDKAELRKTMAEFVAAANQKGA